MQGTTRTTVVFAGALERTPRRTRGVLLLAFEVEHDERQLELALEEPRRGEATALARAA